MLQKLEGTDERKKRVLDEKMIRKARPERHFNYTSCQLSGYET